MKVAPAPTVHLGPTPVLLRQRQLRACHVMLGRKLQMLFGRLPDSKMLNTLCILVFHFCVGLFL